MNAKASFRTRVFFPLTEDFGKELRILQIILDNGS